MKHSINFLCQYAVEELALPLRTAWLHHAFLQHLRLKCICITVAKCYIPLNKEDDFRINMLSKTLSLSKYCVIIRTFWNGRFQDWKEQGDRKPEESIPETQTAVTARLQKGQTIRITTLHPGWPQKVKYAVQPQEKQNDKFWQAKEFSIVWLLIWSANGKKIPNRKPRKSSG